MAKTAKAAPPSDLMTKAEVAAYLRVTPRAVELMSRDGRLTAYTLGERIVRWKRPEVEAALQVLIP